MITAARQVNTLIIGAGIAGAAMAYALRGQNVLVVESAANIAAGASGNPKGIIRPFLSFGNSEMREFYHAAYQECIALLSKIAPECVLQTGILQLPNAGEARFSQAEELAGLGTADMEYLSARQTSELLGTECLREGIYWKRAAVVDPAQWAAALLGDTPVQTQTRIIKLSRQHDTWHAETDKGETMAAQRVIITAGNAIELLPADIANQIRPRAGQISFVPRAALPILPRALSFGHYWIPPCATDDDHLIGATFDISDHASVTAAGHQHNISALQNLADALPELLPAFQKLIPEICIGRAAVRATTHHHMPLYGEADTNLYYLTGLGSRGLMSAPYVARQLCKIMDLGGKKD